MRSDKPRRAASCLWMLGTSEKWRKSGTIDGALHAPRGMIEFWFDPQSPYFRDVYGQADKTYVLFCNADWRSALSATSLQDMEIPNIAQLKGGSPLGAKQVERSLKKRVNPSDCRAFNGHPAVPR